MERLLEYCKATTKEIESSFILNFARTELQKFNSRVDKAYAHALQLDKMTQESFIKMNPQDINNNTQPCSGKEKRNPEDELKSQGRILDFLKRHGRKINESENNTKKDENDWGEKQLDAISGKNEEKLNVCEDDDGQFVPRKLLLFKVEKFKNENDGILGIRKSIKKFRAPEIPKYTHSTQENEGGGRPGVRKSTKTFRAPNPKCTRSSAINDSWIGDNRSRRVIRKSTKTFRAPDPKSTGSTPAEYLQVSNTKPQETSPSFRSRVKKFFGFR